MVLNYIWIVLLKDAYEKGYVTTIMNRNEELMNLIILII